MFKKKKKEGFNFSILSVVFIVFAVITSVISCNITNQTTAFIFSNLTYFMITFALVCFGFIFSSYLKKSKKIDLIGILVISIIVNFLSYLSLCISNESNQIFIYTFSLFIYISVFLNIITLIMIAIDWIKKGEQKKIIRFFVIALTTLLTSLYFIYLSNSMILRSDTLFNYAGYIYIMTLLNIFTFCFTYLIRKIVYPNK